MKKYLNKIPKGTIVLFSSGEYSDYSVIALMEALVDIDPDQIRDEYISVFPEQIQNHSFTEDMFLIFLKERNLFKEVNTPRWMEWHLSEYRTVSGMKVYDGPILFT